MSQPKDENPQSPEGLVQDNVKGSHIPGGPGTNYLAHNHVDTVIYNLVTPSSLSKSASKYPDSHVVELGLDLTEELATDEHLGKREPSVMSDCLKNGPGCSRGYYDDSEEDRPGSFDYMPSQSSHVRIANRLNPPYDEKIKLDSSSSTVESPRSDQDEGSVVEKEAKSVSKEAPCVPDTEHKHPCWHCMPCGNHSDDEDMEDERDPRRVTNTTNSFTSSFTRTIKQVDECVPYNLKPLSGPGAAYTCKEFIPHSFNSFLDQCASDGSKGDKQKSHSKDDSDKLDVSGPVDINGNPRLLDPVNFIQMRQWPRGKSSSSVPGAQSSYTSIAIPPSANSSGGDPNAFDRKKERRRMKLERLKGTPAEAYQGHRKFSDIKEILDFVEGPNTLSKSENKSTKKKQERSRKKEHHINGPLILEDSAEAEDVSGHEEPVVVIAEARVAERAMGNSFRRAVGENSISKTWSEDDTDKSNFHDCLSTVPAELVTSKTEPVTSKTELVTSKAEPVTSEFAISNREHQQSTDQSENIIKTVFSSTLIHQSDSLPSWDSHTEKHSIDSKKAVTKKSNKAKIRKEKQDIKDINNGPISSKVNMVKPKETVKETILVASMVSTRSVKLNNSMDKELLPDIKREESFTEVKKRKKRLAGKDPHAATRNKFVSSSYHPHINSIYPLNSNQRLQTGTLPPPPPVVSTVAASVASSSTSWSSSSQTQFSRDQFSRDLSPSAFPVLSSQGSPSTFNPETRRNSCGDLNSDSIDSKIYDSDRESAKSLPAAHVTRIGGELSPVYLVSYARMAAVLRKNDNTISPNSHTCISSMTRNSSANSNITQSVGSSAASGELPPAHCNAVATPERKTTVWKGSPRERRHSIGSSPEDIVDGEKSSVTERNRQCGSQEVLSRSVVSSKDVVASSSIQIHTSETSGSSHTSTDPQVTSSLVKCSSNQLKTSSVSSAMHLAKSQSDEQKATSQSTEYAIVNTGSPTVSTSALIGSASILPCSHSSVTIASSGAPENINDEHNSRRTKNCAQTSKLSASLPTADNSSKSALSKNKLPAAPDFVRKSSSTKSVIFLDKRFDSTSPANLGITFGFDSSFEPKCEPASQPSNQPPQQPPTSSALPSSFSPNICDTSEQTTLQHSTVTQEPPHIPSTAHIAVAMPNPPPSSTLHIKLGNPSNSHIPKGPHIHGPRNGLILPSNSSENYSFQQDQISSCDTRSSSVCSSTNSHQAMTPTHRIKLSAKPVDTVNLNVNSVRNIDPLFSFVSDNIVFSTSDPLVPSRIPSPTETPQSGTSTEDTVIEKSSDSTAQKICTKVAFPATCGQPPHPSQAVTTDSRNNNNDSLTLSLHSSQENKDNFPTSQVEPNLTEPNLRESSTISQKKTTNRDETKDILEVPVPPNIAVAPSPTIEPSQTQVRTLDLSKPVVYGLKVKPNIGCGKILFVPSNNSKKSRANFSEISSFLTTRWFEDVIKRKGTGAFVTLDEE